MKWKTNLENDIVVDADWQPIIFITYDKYIFNDNDDCHEVLQEKNHFILSLKDGGKDVIVSDFLLLWSRLNMPSLSDKDQNNPIGLGVLLEIVEFLEYRKNHDRYEKEEKLVKQDIKTVSPIAKILYQRYEILISFDNTTYHLVFTSNVL